MAIVETTAAFSVFESQLRTLCLEEFPCGTGSWRENNKKKACSLTSQNKVEEKFSITLKDYGSQHEKTESLEEYISVKKSPWNLDYSWSNEAKSLREIAVRSPWLIDQNFIFGYFKTLRICDKGVTEVDKRLLKFRNLEELTLSSNMIVSVRSENLPPSLKVLELCANQVSDLSGLCVKPPSLLHLGLGMNKVSYIGDYLTGDYWPHLLSLDLSHNNLSDLLDIIRKLGTVPNLRNLVLQGNPLSLIPGYRGYTVDSLRKLTILDDLMITADEKHHFKGLARRREFILDEAKVFLEVHYIKGIPMPDELKNPEDQPEYPIVEKKYYVEFMYLQDRSSKADVFTVEADKGDSSPPPDSEPIPQSETKHTVEEPVAEGKVMEAKQESELDSDVPKIVLFAKEAEIVPEPEHPANDAGRQSCYTEQGTEIPSPSESSPRVETTRFALAPVQSDGLPWSEDLEINWSTQVVRDDLVKLRDFFRAGMELRILEEKVLGYPPEVTSEGESSSPTSKKSDKGGGGKPDKNSKTDKKKDDKAAKGGKDGKKKKKTDVEEELVRSPPEITTIAVFHASLEELLDGEYDLEYQFTKVLGEGESEEDSKAEIKKKDGKKDKDAKKKETEKKEQKLKDKARPKSSRSIPDKKDGKGKGKTGGVVEEDDEAALPPPPLQVSIAVRLHHWNTAYDSVKEEEERNRVINLPQAPASVKGDN
ncbi:LOW QUALITY PROTEIN: leucine-rich repeat-containing protein 43-like [Liolophura sinensis]|uniref:LOW QUALITY PROTEIN: leucine-rich repeat-containing protein 43-like n=1 Tax=Liolophura sinensis TaxID=3198878 RepID=UPI0031584FBF